MCCLVDHSASIIVYHDHAIQHNMSRQYSVQHNYIHHLINFEMLLHLLQCHAVYMHMNIKQVGIACLRASDACMYTQYMDNVMYR